MCRHRHAEHTPPRVVRPAAAAPVRQQRASWRCAGACAWQSMSAEALVGAMVQHASHAAVQRACAHALGALHGAARKSDAVDEERAAEVCMLACAERGVLRQVVHYLANDDERGDERGDEANEENVSRRAQAAACACVCLLRRRACVHAQRHRPAHRAVQWGSAKCTHALGPLTYTREPNKAEVPFALGVCIACSCLPCGGVVHACTASRADRS